MRLQSVMVRVLCVVDHRARYSRHAPPAVAKYPVNALTTVGSAIVFGTGNPASQLGLWDPRMEGSTIQRWGE